jgi:hypothetical protein
MMREGMALDIPVLLRQKRDVIPGWFESKRIVQGFLLLIAIALAFLKDRSPPRRWRRFCWRESGLRPPFQNQK